MPLSPAPFPALLSQVGAGPRSDLWAYSAAGRLRTCPHESVVTPTAEKKTWGNPCLPQVDPGFSRTPFEKKTIITYKLPGASLILLPFAIFFVGGYEPKCLSTRWNQLKPTAKGWDSPNIFAESQQFGTATGDFFWVLFVIFPSDFWEFFQLYHSCYSIVSGMMSVEL